MRDHFRANIRAPTFARQHSHEQRTLAILIADFKRIKK